MLSMSVDGINFIGQFHSIGAIIDIVYNKHKLTTVFVGEFEEPAKDAHATGNNFYTHWEMDHKVRATLKNCVWNRIPGVPLVFQEALIQEFDKLAHHWLMNYSYVGCREQALTIKKYVLNTDKSQFEEVPMKVTNCTASTGEQNESC